MTEPAKATEIPLYASNLTINVGRDGVWLHFSTETGLYASMNMGNYSLERGNIIGKALRQWCIERQEQAKQIEQDNGQFGVGA